MKLSPIDPRNWDSEEIPQNVQPYLDREIKYISKSNWGRKSIRILALSTGEIMGLPLARAPFAIDLKSRETNEQWQQPWRCTRLELTLSVSECMNAYPNPLKKLGHSSRSTWNIFLDHLDHIQASTEHF